MRREASLSRRTVAVTVLPILALVVLWEWWVSEGGLRSFLLGSPTGIAKAVWRGVTSGRLLNDMVITGAESLLGLLLGTAVGTVIGLGMWYSGRFAPVIRPYLFVIGAVPAFALAPALVLWFGTGFASKVVLAFLSTVVIAALQSSAGAAEADNSLVAVLRAFGASRRQALTKVVLPSALAWVLAGVRLNAGMALLGAFVGEFIAASSGVGHSIIVAQGLYRMNEVWAGAIGLIALAAGFQLLAWPIERWAMSWRP